MEELESSIGVMFGQIPATEEQRHNAATFCNEFVENNYKNWQAFF